MQLVRVRGVCELARYSLESELYRRRHACSQLARGGFVQTLLLTNS